MGQYNMDLDAALALAVQYHDLAKSEFLRLLAKVPSFGPEIDGELWDYITSLANWTRGNVCWVFESRRYFGNKGAEVQKTRYVRLTPKAEGRTAVPLVYRDSKVKN
jgi:hypothetical protein